jgi:hypothetical protein
MPSSLGTRRPKRSNIIYVTRDARVNLALLLAASLGHALMLLSGEVKVGEGQRNLLTPKFEVIVCEPAPDLACSHIQNYRESLKRVQA